MKKPQPNFSIDDLLEELPELREGSGYSVQELADKKGLAENTISKKLNILYHVGKLEVSFRKGTNRIGRPIWTPVYTLKQKGGDCDDPK